jgi:hypothetical protein
VNAIAGPMLGHQLAHERFEAIAGRIAFPGMVIEILHEQVMPDGGKAPLHVGHYLRCFCPGGRCNRTGALVPWRGRKWRLSQHMTDMEVVNTAFLAVMACYEHELRELFKVDGVAVMNSHRDLHEVIGFMRAGGGHGREEHA